MYGYHSISPSSSVASSSSLTSGDATHTSDHTSASCAYPSWPRRSSLSSGVTEEATSFVSDDDLFVDVFDEESTDCSPLYTPNQANTPAVTTRYGDVISGSTLRHLLAAQKQQMQNQQCYIPSTTKSKKKKRKSSTKSRASSVTKPMSVIVEAGE